MCSRSGYPRPRILGLGWYLAGKEQDSLQLTAWQIYVHSAGKSHPDSLNPSEEFPPGPDTTCTMLKTEFRAYLRQRQRFMMILVRYPPSSQVQISKSCRKCASIFSRGTPSQLGTACSKVGMKLGVPIQSWILGTAGELVDCLFGMHTWLGRPVCFSRFERRWHRVSGDYLWKCRFRGVYSRMIVGDSELSDDTSNNNRSTQLPGPEQE